MLLILLGVVAAAIIGAGVGSRNTPLNRPPLDYEINVSKMNGGIAPESVQVFPNEYYKYRHIVHQAYDYSCGSAALTTVLQFHLGLPVTEQDAMKGMLEHGEQDKIVARRGFSLLDMKRYVATLGSDSGGFRGDMNDLAKLDQPAIVPIDYAGFKHFVVLRGVRGGLVFIADPAAGNYVLSLENFAKLWDRNTLFIVYPPKNRPPIGQLALSDKELGVFDMDRVKDGSDLAPLEHEHMLERAVNTGFSGSYVRKR
jgi:uncharacterized protein